MKSVLKKRIIFTLLYDSGNFMLSRNFRLQRVGNLEWLQKNYNFSHISFYIDELIVLDVTRGDRDFTQFCETLKLLTAGCFIPIAAGGGVRNIENARELLRSGADKIVVNTPLFEDPDLVKQLSSEFGQQCVVGSVDMKLVGNAIYQVFTDNGSRALKGSPKDMLSWLDKQWVGELYLNSIDKDGTGQGYDYQLLEQLPDDCSVPVILAGGVGNGTHLSAGIANPNVDAVATAHLFNFVGNGLQHAREFLINEGVSLATWPDRSCLTL